MSRARRQPLTAWERAHPKKRRCRPQHLRDFRLIVDAQFKDRVYAPCPCGSGKAWKFCCKNKPLPEEEAKP